MLELIGWIGSVLLACCGIPQAYSSHKDGHSDGISHAFLWMWAIGEVLTFTYVLGFQTLSLPLIANYAVNILVLLVIIKYKYFPRIRVQVRQIKPYLYHVNFRNMYEMASMFLRFQEYYESPEFKGKVFTLKEFKKWYSKNFGRDGKFTYYEDWSGFNIPSEVLKPFYEGKFDPLSKKEKALLEEFKDVKGDFYIIGTFDSYKYIDETLRHEIAHAMFRYNPEYKKEIIAALGDEKYEDIVDVLKNKWGYNNSVIQDETHAFLLTNRELMTEAGLNIDKYSEVIKKITEIFNKYNKD
jgi:uncharacterized protein with PQ loop repeat